MVNDVIPARAQSMLDKVSHRSVFPKSLFVWAWRDMGHARPCLRLVLKSSTDFKVEWSVVSICVLRRRTSMIGKGLVKDLAGHFDSAHFRKGGRTCCLTDGEEEQEQGGGEHCGAKVDS